MQDPYDAFCRHSEAFLEGTDGGPLAGLTFAAKDVFDVAGHVTGCGNPHFAYDTAQIFFTGAANGAATKRCSASPAKSATPCRRPEAFPGVVAMLGWRQATRGRAPN